VHPPPTQPRLVDRPHIRTHTHTNSRTDTGTDTHSKVKEMGLFLLQAYTERGCLESLPPSLFSFNAPPVPAFLLSFCGVDIPKILSGTSLKSREGADAEGLTLYPSLPSVRLSFFLSVLVFPFSDKSAQISSPSTHDRSHSESPETLTLSSLSFSVSGNPAPSSSSSSCLSFHFTQQAQA